MYQSNVVIGTRAIKNKDKNTTMQQKKVYVKVTKMLISGEINLSSIQKIPLLEIFCKIN